MTFLDGHGIRHRGRQLGFAPSREWWADCQQAFGYFDAESTADVVTCLGCMALTGKSPSAQLEKLAKELHAMAEEQYKEEFRKRVARTCC